jgi:hypothetical protein
MYQVGHADSKMTMDVYAQLQQRAKRDHGAHFDELVARRGCSCAHPSKPSRTA